MDKLWENDEIWFDNLQKPLYSWQHDEIRMNQWLMGVKYVGYLDVGDCSFIMQIVLYEEILFLCGDKWFSMMNM